MLRSSFFNDPFFAGAEDHMRMDEMYNQNFGRSGRRDRLALSDGRRQQQRAQNMQVAERDMYMDPFAHFGNMFSNMHSMMTDMRKAFESGAEPNGDGHVFHQSSFMSCSNMGNGAPKIYQASTSSKQGPGGIRETRKTVRDSEAGIDKIAVGHHIRDRGHVIERQRNNKTGEIGENKEYINLDEEEAPEFEQEYREKWQNPVRSIDQRRHAERSRHAPVTGSRRYYAPLPEPEQRRHRKSHH